MESIIDKRIRKKTRRKEYFEYLVKWKGHLVEDVSWEDEAEIQKHGKTVQELMKDFMKIFKRGSMMQEHRTKPKHAPSQGNSWMCRWKKGMFFL